MPEDNKELKENEMQGRSRISKRVLGLMISLIALQTEAAIAGNKLELTHVSDERLSIRLSNTDPVAGLQFSINARGGVALQAYEGSARLASAGVQVYQFLKDDSTLNVVLLAPVRCSLPVGDGAIGLVSYAVNPSDGHESARVFINRVAMCDADAKSLELSTCELVWDLHDKNASQSPVFTLEPNFPNPFNPSTTITYTIAEGAQVSLAVYDITGRQVNILVDQYQSQGRYSVRWNAASDGSARLASGMYVARLQVGGKVATQKMILTK